MLSDAWTCAVMRTAKAFDSMNPETEVFYYIMTYALRRVERKLGLLGAHHGIDLFAFNHQDDDLTSAESVLGIHHSESLIEFVKAELDSFSDTLKAPIMGRAPFPPFALWERKVCGLNRLLGSFSLTNTCPRKGMVCPASLKVSRSQQ